MDAEGPLDVIPIKTDCWLQSYAAMSFFLNRGHLEQQVSVGSLLCHSNWQLCYELGAMRIGQCHAKKDRM